MSPARREQVQALLVRLKAAEYAGPEYCALVRELDALVTTPRVSCACPHCGAVMHVPVCSLKVRTTRRCPRCGRGYTPTQQEAA